MTRKQIESEYQTYPHNPIVICSPGKFEGEPVWAPYFYDAMLNGEVGDHINGVDYFIVCDADRDEFPELVNVYGIALEESEQGFVHVSDLDTKEDYKHDTLMQSKFGDVGEE